MIISLTESIEEKKTYRSREIMYSSSSSSSVSWRRESSHLLRKMCRKVIELYLIIILVLKREVPENKTLTEGS
jgi:hypothetical protein